MKTEPTPNSGGICQMLMPCGIAPWINTGNSFAQHGLIKPNMHRSHSILMPSPLYQLNVF